MNTEKLKLEIFKKLDREPLNTRIINQLACVTMEEGDFEGALKLFRKAFEVNSTVQSANNLAYFYLHEGDYQKGDWVSAEDKAIDLLLQAIKLNPNLSYPYSLLGEAYLKKHQFSDAVDVLKKAVRISNTAANHNNIGVALYKQGKYKAASLEFLTAHSLDEDAGYDFNSYLSYGICLGQRGMYAEAESVAKFLLNSKEVKANGSVEIIDIAKIYFLTGNYSKAAEIFSLSFEEFMVAPCEFSMYIYSLKQLNLLEKAKSFLNKAVTFNNEWIDDLKSEESLEENSIEEIKSLELETEQYRTSYNDILKGVKPGFQYEPQIKEECYIFGCILHNNPYNG